MIEQLKIVIPFVLAFAALSLAFIAVRIGLRATPRPDPFSLPFGEMPLFTPQELRLIAAAKPTRSRYGARSQAQRRSSRLRAGPVVLPEMLVHASAVELERGRRLRNGPRSTR